MTALRQPSNCVWRTRVRLLSPFCVWFWTSGSGIPDSLTARVSRTAWNWSRIRHTWANGTTKTAPICRSGSARHKTSAWLSVPGCKVDEVISTFEDILHVIACFFKRFTAKPVSKLCRKEPGDVVFVVFRHNSCILSFRMITVWAEADLFTFDKYFTWLEGWIHNL